VYLKLAMYSPQHVDEAVNYDVDESYTYCPTPPQAHVPTSPGSDPPPSPPSPSPPPPPETRHVPVQRLHTAASLPPYASAAATTSSSEQDAWPPRRLYIGGIDRAGPFRQTVREIAEKYGPLARAVFIGHQPFAIVTFTSGWDAQRCMRELHHRSHPELTRGPGQLDIQPLRDWQCRPDVLPPRSYQRHPQQQPQHKLHQHYYPTVTSTSTTPLVLPPHEAGRPAHAPRNGGAGRKRHRSRERSPAPRPRSPVPQQHQAPQSAAYEDHRDRRRLRSPSPAHKRHARDDRRSDRRPSPHRVAFVTLELRFVARDVTHEELRRDLGSFGSMAFPPVLEPEGGVARIYFHDIRAAHAAVQHLDGQMGKLSERKQCLRARILS
jgi:hypothetical protein